MKKLFTLVCGLLFAFVADAITFNVGDPKNNTVGSLVDGGTEYTFFDASTKIVTFYASNDYRPGWWFEIWDDKNKVNNAADYSDYDNFVVEFDNPDAINVNVVVQYKGSEVKSEASSNGTKIVVPLDPSLKKVVSQAFIQTPDEVSETAPKVITFKKAYFENSVEAPKTVAIWEGKVALSWKEGGRVAIPADAFVNAKAGDVMTVCYDQLDGQWGQAQFNYGDWCEKPEVNFTEGNVKFTKTLVPTDVYGWSFNSRETELVLTQDILDNIKAHKQTYTEDGTGYTVENVGLIIQGSDLTFTKVLLPESAATNISNAVVAPKANVNAPIYNLAGQQVNKSYKGVVVQNGKKFVQK